MPTFAQRAHETMVLTIRKNTRLACIRRFLRHQSVLGTRWFSIKGALAVGTRRRGKYRVLAGPIGKFAQECFANRQRGKMNVLREREDVV